MKKKQDDSPEMKRRKSKNSHWICYKRSAGRCALWQIAVVASVGFILRRNVFKLLLEDGLTDRSRLRWWTKGVTGGNWTTPTKETTVENQRKDERVIRRGLGEAEVVFWRGTGAEAQGCGEMMMLMDAGANATDDGDE